MTSHPLQLLPSKKKGLKDHKKTEHAAASEILFSEKKTQVHNKTIFI